MIWDSPKLFKKKEKIRHEYMCPKIAKNVWTNQED